MTFPGLGAAPSVAHRGLWVPQSRRSLGRPVPRQRHAVDRLTGRRTRRCGRYGWSAAVATCGDLSQLIEMCDSSDHRLSEGCGRWGTMPMMIQWCVKGLSLPDDAVAKSIIDRRSGLQCNWWRDVHRITPEDVREKLTPDNLELHVNQFTSPDPATGRPFCEVTPFISLSAGTVERDTVMATNVAHRARRTAIYFGSDYYQKPVAYLFVCWLVVAPRRAVAVECVAEEVRDLNVYRSYSDFQTEGEITAKVQVPANQIRQCEKWRTDPGGKLSLEWTHRNPTFTRPETLSNIRALI
jgi:hypothetical protein